MYRKTYSSTGWLSANQCVLDAGVGYVNRCVMGPELDAARGTWYGFTNARRHFTQRSENSCPSHGDCCPYAGVSRRLDGKPCGRLGDKVKKISGVEKSEMLQRK